MTNETMNPLKGRHVVLGVSGSIAAYKACALASLLVKRGAEVHPVLTRGGARFITAESLSALCGRPVLSGPFDQDDPYEMTHIALAERADLFVVAPASANLIARIAAGMADDMLTILLTVTRAPVLVAPAMNTLMWTHPRVSANVEILESLGYRIIEPNEGRLACGITGPGKLAEPEEILAVIEATLAIRHSPPSPSTNFPTTQSPNHPTPQEPNHPTTQSPNNLTTQRPNHPITQSPNHPITQSPNHPISQFPNFPISLAPGLPVSESSTPDLAGLRIMVTAGPTREPIDPVRFLGNRSSGKMGYAIAQAAVERGAKVILISGPTSLPPPQGIEIIRVETAAEMRQAVLNSLDGVDVVIAAAAVADFRIASPESSKIKRGKGNLTLTLEPTEDILAEIGRQKNGRFHVGFAAEVGDPLASARSKLESKNLDLIVANDVAAADAGFEVDTNRVIFLGRQGTEERLPLLSKREVAARLLDRVVWERSSFSKV